MNRENIFIIEREWGAMLKPWNKALCCELPNPAKQEVLVALHLYEYVYKGCICIRPWDQTNGWGLDYMFIYFSRVRLYSEIQ